MHAFALSIAAAICFAAGLSGPHDQVRADQKPIVVEAPDSDAVDVAYVRPVVEIQARA